MNDWIFPYFNPGIQSIPDKEPLFDPPDEAYLLHEAIQGYLIKRQQMLKSNLKNNKNK